MVEVAGDHGIQREDVVIGNTSIDVMAQFIESRPSTIYGGSNEIQRNIIAKQVLGLPSCDRLYREAPGTAGASFIGRSDLAASVRQVNQRGADVSALQAEREGRIED